MPDYPEDIRPPFSFYRRVENWVRLASFDSFSPQRPDPSLRANVATSPQSSVVAANVQRQRAAFAAYGVRPFTRGNYIYVNGALETGYDLALYKTRTGAGYYKRYVPPLAKTFLGSLTVSYSLVGGQWKADVPNVDEGYVFDDGGGAPSPVCDESEYVGVSPSGMSLVEPSFWHSFSASIINVFWEATSSTEVGPRPGYAKFDVFSVCPDSTATITLSDACTWEDVATESEKVLTDGYGTYDYGDYPQAVAYNTGSGASDGTRYMRKVVGRYRVLPAAYRRRVYWREVTRQNNAGFTRVIEGSSPIPEFSPQTTLRRTELSEPISRPYYDEFGGWAPADLRWEDVTSEKLWRWNANSSNEPLYLYGVVSGSLVGEQGWDGPVVFATRLRVQVPSHDSALVARVVVLSPPPPGEVDYASETVDLPITSGLSSVLERVAPDWPLENYLRLGSVTILRGGEPDAPLTAAARVRYRQRQLLRVAGFPALDGTDELMAPKRYRVETRVTEWGLDATVTNGSDYDSGLQYQMPATGSARLETRKAYNLTTGAPEWTGEFGEIVERVGSFAGLPWLPASHVSVPSTPLTATLSEVATALSPTYQLLVPLDANAPRFGAADSLPGAELASVSREEVVEAGEYGVWHDVNCPVRGAAVFIEDLGAVRLTPVP